MSVTTTPCSRKGRFPCTKQQKKLWKQLAKSWLNWRKSWQSCYYTWSQRSNKTTRYKWQRRWRKWISCDIQRWRLWKLLY